MACMSATMDGAETFTAFQGDRQIGSGDLLSVARAACGCENTLLVFEDATGRPVELDLRFGPERAVETHIALNGGEPPPAMRQGRGRPKLGVVAREVTLLPRHWEWLGKQPGGASAALRRLVEDARRAASGADRQRQLRDALYRIMSALAGDLPHFEDASRALFAADDVRFDQIVTVWPPDVAGYVTRLALAERTARSAA